MAAYRPTRRGSQRTKHEAQVLDLLGGGLVSLDSIPS
jgi:hypothetical protein